MTWQPAVLINLDCAMDMMRIWTRMKTKTIEMLTKSLVKDDKDEDED